MCLLYTYENALLETECEYLGTHFREDALASTVK